MIGNTFFFAWEVALMQFLQEGLNGITENLAVLFTLFGEPILVTGVVAFFYLVIDKQLGKRICLTLIMATTGGAMIKNVALRRRPYMDHSQIRCVRAPQPKADPMDIAQQGYSCPSLHAANSAAGYGGLGYNLKKKGIRIGLMILPFFVGCSRFFLGVHYPTDVMLGWGFGVVILMIQSIADKKIQKEGIWHLICLAVFLPGLFFCDTTEYFSGYGLLIGFAAGTFIERHYVNFRMTAKPIRAAVRYIAGVCLFMAVLEGVKYLMPADLRDATNLAGLLIRMARYAIGTCFITGIYPMLFVFWDRVDNSVKN